MFTSKTNVRRMAVLAVSVISLATLCGCNELLGALGVGSMLGGWGGGYNLGGYNLGGYGGGYDASGLIGSVVDNRLGAMDNAATAWDQYITGDYYGGDNDDLSTPTYWASGYEWP
jgi:hypothetical protein